MGGVDVYPNNDFRNYVSNSSDHLEHHGILGMKWGVRRFQNADGTLTDEGKKRYSIIKKGSAIYRVTNNPDDKTYDNKKYVSITPSDHRKWQKYIGDSYNNSGGQAYNVMYTPVKDLEIAPYTKVGEIWYERAMKDKKFKEMSINDTKYASERLKYKSDDSNDMLSLNFAMQTNTGKLLMNALKEQGYQGVQDRHGQNVSKNPVIIFDPDKNLHRSGVSVYRPKKIQ